MEDLNWVAILAAVSTAAWGICEALNMIPSVRANSVFQLIYNFLGSLRKPKPPEIPPSA